MTRAELRQAIINDGGELPGVYRIVGPKSKPAICKNYVGQAHCVVDRIEEHIDSPDHRVNSIDTAIEKYGWEDFDFIVEETILDDTLEEQLNHREAALIEKYDSKANGWNKTKGNHTDKVQQIKKYIDKHIVPAEMINKIPGKFGATLLTLIHNFDPKYVEAAKTWFESVVDIINWNYVKTNATGKLEEDTDKLGEYILKELDRRMNINETDLGKVIANVPYGAIGAEIMTKLVNNFNFIDCYSLEPGNDYFTKDKLYKHLDPSFRPIICRLGCFRDASQVTVIAKLQKEENNLSEIEARILLHLDTDGNKELLNAITEYVLKVDNIGKIKFSFNGNGNDLIFDDKEFMFSSGGFDISHGYLAITTTGKAHDWSEATNFNVFGQNTKGNIPHAKIKNRTNFVKMIYSELGLKILKVLFHASPENWGYTGFFANIDYTTCRSFIDLFNILGLSNQSQNTILEAASEIQLNDKELEICKIVEAM